MCHRADTEFLSTLSLRRATIFALWMEASHLLFLSTLSLRRATCYSFRHSASCRHFYPRSPCGERPVISFLPSRSPTFLSTLSLRRATTQMQAAFKGPEISIHALLAESDHDWPPVRDIIQWISIHALLAESDMIHPRLCNAKLNFYPRSPCGERL